jgi:hypothetical protein
LITWGFAHKDKVRITVQVKSKAFPPSGCGIHLHFVRATFTPWIEEVGASNRE